MSSAFEPSFNAAGANRKKQSIPESPAGGFNMRTSAKPLSTVTVLKLISTSGKIEKSRCELWQHGSFLQADVHQVNRFSKNAVQQKHQHFSQFDKGPNSDRTVTEHFQNCSSRVSIKGTGGKTCKNPQSNTFLHRNFTSVWTPELWLALHIMLTAPCVSGMVCQS